MARKLEVQIVGDASSLERAFGKAGKASSGFGNALRTTARVAGGAALALGGGMAASVGIGIKSLLEHEKADARLQNVLKTTGNAANTNMKAIRDLADEMEKKSGIDDVAIKSSAGLLLTFKNLRNEAGKGNDMFDQSVKIANDLSVALGKDLQSSSIMVGKALNDPIKGLTALGRAGVQFTEGQKKQITAMVESGNVMGAQKLIMAELTSQVGGAAEALGGTMAGRLNILKARLEEVAESVAAKVLPIFEKFVAWVEKNWPQIEAVIKGVFAAIGAAWESVLRPALEALIAGVKIVVDWVKQNWPEISRIATEVFGKVKEVISDVVVVVSAIWSRFGDDITKVAKTTFGTVFTIIGNVFKQIENVFQLFAAIFRGDWSRAWSELKQIVSLALNSVVTLIKGMVSNFVTIAKALGGAILDGIAAGLKGLGTMVLGKLSELGGIIKGWVGSARAFAASIGSAIVAGIKGGIAAGWEGLKSWIGGKLNELKDTLTFWGSGPDEWARKAIGIPVAQGIGKGIAKGMGGAEDDAIVAVKRLKKTFHVALSALTDASHRKKFEDEITVFFRGSLSHVPVDDLKEFAAKGAQATVAGFKAGLKGAEDDVLVGVKHLGKSFQVALSSLTDAGQRKRFEDEVSVFFRGSLKHVPLDDLVLSAQTGGHRVGRAFVQSLIFGTEALPEKMAQKVKDTIEKARAVVEEKRAAFSEAFSKLSGDALTAFDATINTWVTRGPAQNLLDKFIARHDLEEFKARLAEAKQALVDAQLGVNFQAVEGETPEQAAARVKSQQEAIAAAQKTVADLMYEQKRAALERDAAEENKQRTATAALKRRHFEEDLAELQKRLTNQGATHKEWHGAIIKLFDKFGVDYKMSGLVLGKSFAQGLRESEEAVVKAAKAIAAAAAPYLKLKSPAEKGPLSDLNKWWDSFASTLLSGLDTRAISGAMGGAAPSFAGVRSQETSVPSLAGTTAFGATEQTIRIPVILDGRQITEVVYEGLKEKSRSSGSLFSASPGVRL